MNIKKLLDDLQNELDIKKKIPKYHFNLWIFRGAIFVLLAFFVYFLISDGVQQRIYINCPKDVGQCRNRLYDTCDEFRAKVTNDSHQSMKDAAAMCSQEFLLPGTVIGEPPNWIYKNFWFLAFALMIFALLLNHVLYNRNYKGDDAV